LIGGFGGSEPGDRRITTIDQDRALMGPDWRPCGVRANREAIDAVLRYHHEQGLTNRRLTCEGIFVPSLQET
jgi:hypothetical protein